MVQVIKHLPGKLKDLSSNPSTSKKKNKQNKIEKQLFLTHKLRKKENPLEEKEKESYSNTGRKDAGITQW